MSAANLLDENLSPSLVNRLWSLGFDTVHVQYRGMLGWLDHDIWKFAISEGRCLVTANGRDFRYLASQTPVHPGVIIVPGSAPRDKQFDYVMAAFNWASVRNSVGISPFQNRVVEVRVDMTVHDELIP